MSPDLQQPRGFAPQPRLDLYVLFDFDQDRPNAEGLAQVQELAKALVARAAGQRYRLIGHTDTQGGATYNQGLSERRATSVRRLVEDQTRALNGRILAAGRGESEPKHPGNDEESHRLNRRVELEALPEP
jgi:outer membrane protein OmpA-like peptidoglycan-associated protein